MVDFPDAHMRVDAAPPTAPRAPDPVNNPSHYTSGEIECIDALRSALTPEEFQGFCKGNAIKYLWRARLKALPDQDMAKAVWYARMARGDDPRVDGR